ncbi:MAG: hypothetical protein JSU87_07695 [Gemmatimonadota bacterium]|nr:MAG: hypothetical protein JSU87_07695 [Gemmatimonadota bacterium]
MRSLTLLSLVFLLARGVASVYAQTNSAAATFKASEYVVAQHDRLLELAYSPSADTVSYSALDLPLPRYGPCVGITKWITLATSVGLGVLGFSISSSADDDFDALLALCNADPPNCRAVNPDGSYQDARLESLYQDVVSKDRQARASLIGAQLSFGASVLLFIVDFQKRGGPSDIPYEPPEEKSAVRLTAKPGELALRYYFR